MTASLHRLLHGLNITDLTKLRRRRERERERERQTSNSFNEQNNSARAWRFFLQIPSPSLHNKDVKWPIF